MIEICSEFSQNEKLFIDSINSFFYLHTKNNVNGKIYDRCGFVRYEIEIGDNEDKIILQFCVRDNEEGGHDFVHISNIMIPKHLSRQGIAKGIITFMSKVANKVLNISFYITGIVNDKWKDSLLCYGGTEDEYGDIEIVYDLWRKNNFNYGIAYLDKNSNGNKENEPCIYVCCCIEELMVVLSNVVNMGYKNLVPFINNGENVNYTWEYVYENEL